MRIVFIGDIVGASGRTALKKFLLPIKDVLKPDVTIVNGENAAHGIGISPNICDEMFSIGVDVITLGNHAFKKRDIMPYMDGEPRLVRPLNFPEGTAGKGIYIHELRDGRSLAVINLMGQVFMDVMLDDPFAKIDRQLNCLNGVTATFIDFHGEATSEKQCMGAFVDGRAAAVIGTHTHVPTADDRILQGGTAYQSDTGMTGDYNSIIGVQKDIPLEGFVQKTRSGPMKPAEGEGSLAGCVIDVDDATGFAKSIETIRLGPHIKETSLAEVRNNLT